jgi:hypothetical protein
VVEALAELLTPSVVDVSRSRRVTRVRITYPDGTVSESAVREGAWRALQSFTRPTAAAADANFVLVGSYEEALELFRRGDVDGALVVGEGTPTGRTDVEVIAFNAGRLPEQLRRTIRDRQPLRSGTELEILASADDGSAITQAASLADALGVFAHVRVLSRAEFDAAITAGRFEVFVGSIPTGAGTDLGVWFRRIGYGGGERALAELEDVTDPARRNELERHLWDRAQADVALVVLSRRPICFVEKP